MKLGHIELFVSDVAVSAAFYRDILHFDLTVDRIPELAWVEKDEVEFLLRRGPGQVPANRYEDASSGIVLYTGDLPATKARLETLGLEFLGTVDSENCLTFTDPDGHWFQLVDPEH